MVDKATATPPRKLRILCLHGYNNTGQIMMHQMQDFINTMGELCEFSFIDGPLNAVGEPPIKYFISRGIIPPYKRWVSQKLSPEKIMTSGSDEVGILKTQANFE